MLQCKKSSGFEPEVPSSNLTAATYHLCDPGNLTKLSELKGDSNVLRDSRRWCVKGPRTKPGTEQAQQVLLLLN